MNPVLEYHLSVFVPSRQLAALKKLVPSLFEGSRQIDNSGGEGMGIHTFAGEAESIARIACLIEVNRSNPISEAMLKSVLGETPE